MSDDFPIVITSAGLQPQPPAVLRAALVTRVAATNPGYTSDLPGSLIEDISSTDVGALALIDSAKVDTVNSLTPYGANDFTLSQLGQIYGVQVGEASNTSVSVVFSGPPGVVVAQGFTVTDGVYQYSLTDGGVIGAGGSSSPLFAVATIPGSWTIAPGTVTGLVTSPPPNLSPPLTVNNPLAGTPGEGEETPESYRSRVLQAGLAVSQGMPSFLRTLLSEVSGVQTRLVSIVQQVGGGWTIIVGGGDPYEVAYAIEKALFDISSLVGSTLSVTGITQANPGVVTTATNHNLTTGDIEQISGVLGMVAVNNIPLTITVISEKTFSIGINTTGYPAYVSGGVVTPNPINTSASLQDYPDTYTVVFVTPPPQTVAVAAVWNTTATNFVSSAAIAQLASPALVNYINSVHAGQPLNLLVMETVFQEAVADVLPPNLLTRLLFSININGVSTPPVSGTGVINGDPVSYFLTDSTQIAITQG